MHDDRSRVRLALHDRKLGEIQGARNDMRLRTVGLHLRVLHQECVNIRPDEIVEFLLVVLRKAKFEPVMERAVWIDRHFLRFSPQFVAGEAEGDPRAPLPQQRDIHSIVEVAVLAVNKRPVPQMNNVRLLRDNLLGSVKQVAQLIRPAEHQCAIIAVIINVRGIASGSRF